MLCSRAADNPIVVGEDVTWPLNVTSTVDVLANDSDVEGSPLTLELVSQPGWVDRADPGGANDNSNCAMFPGQRCP